jgi:hypothetical protein
VLKGVWISALCLKGRCPFIDGPGAPNYDTEKPSGQFLGLIRIRDSSFCFSFIIVSFGESRLLVP